MDIVRDVLEQSQKNLEKFKSINVEKHLETRNDIGLLMCTDPNELDEKQLSYVQCLLFLHTADRT